MCTIIGVIIGAIFGFCLEIFSCIVDVVNCSGGGVAIFSITIPCAIIGGVVGLVIDIFMAKEDADFEKAQAEKERRDAEQAKLDSAFSEWWKKLISCYVAIESNVEPGILFDPGDLYEPIWELEKVQPEPRYKTNFDQRLEKHINWLRGRIDYNLKKGFYALAMSLTSVRCLKKAYHENSGFDSVIDILAKLYERTQVDTYCIRFLQYGDCKLSVTELSDQAVLGARIAELKSKIQSIDKAYQMEKVYYGNIVPDMANYIDYAAELIWCIAVRKPFNQNEFNEACEIFACHTRKNTVDGKAYVTTMYEKAYEEENGQEFWKFDHVEQLLALIYAKNLIGGQNTVDQEKKKVMDWVDAAIEFDMINQCYLLTSALAWMGLYKLERDVLRYLVEQKVNLPEEWQDRLGFLESGGTSNIKIYDVDSDSTFLYDSSALDWNSDAFELFFRKLEMTHKTMKYSLAISRWTKTLPLARGQKITQEEIENSFNRLVEDFDGEVVVCRKKAKAINLANVEYENSFIFRFKAERNRCISILFSSEKYGRNLNLTIIVLFTPESGLSTEELRKYALAIKDNIYVESFRESILQAVDEVIKPKQTIYDNELSDEGELTEQSEQAIYGDYDIFE